MNLNFQQFAALALTYNVIPLFQELPADLDTPVTAYAKLRNKKFGFLFESVVGGEKWARYSFLGVAPRQTIQLQEGKWEMVGADGKKSRLPLDHQDPLKPLRDITKAWRTYQDKKLPRFFGGLVGFWGYGMVSYFDAIPRSHVREKKLPDVSLMLMDQVVIFDNLAQVMRIVASVFIENEVRNDPKKLRKLYDQALVKIATLRRKLSRRVTLRHSFSHGAQHSSTRVTSVLQQKDFENLVQRAKSYIEAGDIFQVVLSNRFVVSPVKEDALAIYRGLRRLNPSPYMYFLELNDIKVVGASPEILVRLEDDQVTVRPIAGTRPRGVTEAEDIALEIELRQDQKELAEHIMLVDLGRNDVGRVAKLGSVQVPEQKMVERYSHVMHLVSHVSGELLNGLDAWDVIRACFPAGTLSGAPKIRAMQIIDEFETVDRGLYGGAVGYVGLTGNTDLAIAIRTAVMVGKKAIVQAGAGIVYNSDPAREYEECVNKAKGMIEAILGERQWL